MELKRSWYSLRAFLLLLVAVLLIGSAAVFVWYLVTHGRWGSDGSFIIPTLFIGFFFLLLFSLLIFYLALWAFLNSMRGAMLRAVSGPGALDAPPAPKQPDRTRALRDGESLTLVMPRGRYNAPVRLAMRIVLLSIILPVLLALPSVLLLPSLNPLPHPSSFEPPAPPPTIFDWMILAYPLALAVLLIVLLSVWEFSVRSQRGPLIADDLGVRLGRKRFIPWRDIRVFVMPSQLKGGSPTGGYLLWGGEHGLYFEIPAQGGTLATGEQYTLPSDAAYDAYYADACRLLATIAARSYTPLRVYTRSAQWTSGLKNRFPLRMLTMEDALAAPVAGAPWQPTAEAVAAARTTSAIELKAAVLSWPMVLESLIYAIFVFAVGFGVLKSQQRAYLDAPSDDSLAYAIGIGMGALIVVPIVIALAYQRRSNLTPPVRSDAFGIVGKVPLINQTTLIPWAEIRAWGVVPPAPGTRQPTRYLLFTMKGQFSWKEPRGARLSGFGVKGDRRVVYRERAEQLHALIVARTGLTPRKFPGGASAEVPALEHITPR